LRRGAANAGEMDVTMLGSAVRAVTIRSRAQSGIARIEAEVAAGRLAPATAAKIAAMLTN